MAPKKTTEPPQEQPTLGFPGDGRPKPSEQIILVKMTRDPIYGHPTEADVHPDEVANWQQHGWVVAE